MIKGVNFKFSAQNTAGPAMKGFQNGLKAVDNSLKSARESMSVFMDRANKLRATFVPAFAETVRFRDSVKELDEAQRIGAISATEYASALASIKADHQGKMGSFEGVPKSAMDSMSAFSAEMDRLRNKFDPIAAATSKYQSDVRELDGALRMGAIGTDQYDAALARLRATFASTSEKAKTFDTTVRDIVNSVNRVNAPLKSAADSMSAFHGEFDRLRNKFNPVAAAMDKYQSELRELDSALRMGAVSQATYNQALGTLRSQVDSARNAVSGLVPAVNRVNSAVAAAAPINRSWQKGLSENRRAFQQIGFQVTDFSVQIAGGQSAMLAFIQQGGQVLQFFGLWGAVLAGFLSVFGTMAYIFIKTGHSIGELRSALGVLPIEMEALRAIAVAVRDAFIDMANLIVNNLDRIIIYAAVVAGFFAGQWVLGMLAAVSVTGLLNGALIFLRANLARTGIGLLIIGAAELVYQFLRLVEAVGGFDKALGMLKDVAAEVFGRIVLSMRLLPAAMSVAANKMAAFFITKLNNMIGAFMEFTWSVAEGLNALFGTTLSGAMLGEVTQGLAVAANGFEDTAAAAEASYGAIMEGVRAPLASITALQETLASVKDGSIDVRDLWGGNKKGDGAGGGGGGGAAQEAQTEADRIKKIFEDMQSSISSSMLGSFKALLKGTKSLGDVVTDILGSIIDQVINLLMTPIFNNIAGGLTSGIMGGLGQIGASFDGGGSTGAGPRAGGMDGKGGRLAMLHPRETVVDHTKGQRMGGVTVQMTVNTPDAESFRRSSRQIALSMQAAMGAGSR